ncbi:hypothetical protein T484DRAFT_1797549 [Baffinella frigidus]|nr:hypothetical protein T484DRAFT_1797549 [Cryptophyta sp. CCMP2293]
MKLMNFHMKRFHATFDDTSRPEVRIDTKFDGVSPLEIRYVVGSAGMQTSLLSTTQGAIVFSGTEAGKDNAGLPGNAYFSAVDYFTNSFVTDVDVVFAASAVNTRPQVDFPMSNMQRDYIHPEHLDPFYWIKVEGSDFNVESGGATVSVWKQRKANVDQYMDWGFEKLDKNLVEQSGRGAIYLMFKRGSGPAVLDILATPTSGYSKITATTAEGAVAALYVKYDSGVHLRRDLQFMPCTGQDEEVFTPQP